MSLIKTLKKKLKRPNASEAAIAIEGDNSDPESALRDQLAERLVPSESACGVPRLSISDLLERRESVSHLFPVIGEPVKSPAEAEDGSIRSRSSTGLSAIGQVFSSVTQKLSSPRRVETSDRLLDDTDLSWTDKEIDFSLDVSPRTPRDPTFIETLSPTACSLDYQLLQPPTISVTTFPDDSLDMSPTTTALELLSLEDGEREERPTSESLALIDGRKTPPKSVESSESSESSDGHAGLVPLEFSATNSSGLDDFQTAWIGCSYRFIVDSNKLMVRLARMGELSREITTGQEIKILARVCLMPGAKQPQSVYVGQELDEAEPHEEDMYFHINLNDVGNIDINIELSAPLGRFRKQKTFSSWTLNVYGTDLILGSTEWKLIESDGKFV